MREDENEEDAARRIGPTKLGITIQVGDKIGERTNERKAFVLHLSDYNANIIDKTPKVPQADTSVTQYVDYKYTNDPTVLFPAAQKGSLCSQNYLTSINVDWIEKPNS